MMLFFIAIVYSFNIEATFEGVAHYLSKEGKWTKEKENMADVSEVPILHDKKNRVILTLDGKKVLKLGRSGDSFVPIDNLSRPGTGIDDATHVELDSLESDQLGLVLVRSISVHHKIMRGSAACYETKRSEIKSLGSCSGEEVDYKLISTALDSKRSTLPINIVKIRIGKNIETKEGTEVKGTETGMPTASTPQDIKIHTNPREETESTENIAILQKNNRGEDVLVKLKSKGTKLVVNKPDKKQQQFIKRMKRNAKKLEPVVAESEMSTQETDTTTESTVISERTSPINLREEPLSNDDMETIKKLIKKLDSTKKQQRVSEYSTSEEKENIKPKYKRRTESKKKKHKQTHHSEPHVLPEPSAPLAEEVLQPQAVLNTPSLYPQINPPLGQSLPTAPQYSPAIYGLPQVATPPNVNYTPNQPNLQPNVQPSAPTYPQQGSQQLANNNLPGNQQSYGWNPAYYPSSGMPQIQNSPLAPSGYVNNPTAPQVAGQPSLPGPNYSYPTTGYEQQQMQPFGTNPATPNAPPYGFAIQPQGSGYIPSATYPGTQEPQNQLENEITLNDIIINAAKSAKSQLKRKFSRSDMSGDSRTLERKLKKRFI